MFKTNQSLQVEINKLKEKISQLESEISSKRVCSECKNFYQHYGYSQGKYQPINCGHCATPRLKDKKPDTKACCYFEYKDETQRTA